VTTSTHSGFTSTFARAPRGRGTFSPLVLLYSSLSCPLVLEPLLPSYLRW
jgi:hypothetical protein